VSDPTRVPDDAISFESEDFLGRSRFAESLAEMIDSADLDASLRIGIYGGWGEGKTSVLRLLRYFLELRKHVCVTITPWAPATKEEVLEKFIKEVAAELEITWFAILRQWAKALPLVVKITRNVAAIDPRIKAADAVLGDAVEDGFGWAAKIAQKQQRGIVLDYINKKLADRKLVVLIDDVDRVRPDQVPDLLLTLREALDQPKYFYVMAIAPEIVEHGLGLVNEKWGEPGTFLEKIIELPRQLPSVTDEQHTVFIEKQLARLQKPPVKDALEGIRSFLPKNPRKLKIFLRSIAALGVDVDRFDPDEVQWDVYYLFQLLRIEFPLESTRLIADAAAMHDLEIGFITNGKPKQGAAAAPKPKLYEPHSPEEASRKARFNEICDAIRKRPRWRGSYDLHKLALLPDDPPHFTRKEAGQLVERFMSTAENKRGQLLDSAVSGHSEPSATRARALFVTLLELRGYFIGSAVEQPTDELVNAENAKAIAVTDMLRHLIDSVGIFANEFVGAKEWELLAEQVEKWAHFVTEPYAELRAREQTILRLALETAPTTTVIAVLNKWDTAGFPRLEAEGDHQEFLLSLRNDMQIRLAVELLDSFPKADIFAGIYSAEGRATAEIAFSTDSPLYRNPNLRERLIKTTTEAKTNLIAQTNCLSFLSKLDYIVWGSNLSGFDRTSAEQLTRDGDVIGALWLGATANPLQRREAGGLLETRSHLVEKVGEDRLPQPEWLKLYAKEFARRAQPRRADTPATEEV